MYRRRGVRGRLRLFFYLKKRKMITLKDFEKAAEKEKKIPSHPKRLALTPLGRFVLKKSVLEGRVKGLKKPIWWKEVDAPDTIPGCFGEYPQELKCEKCNLNVWCDKQKKILKKA